MRAMRACQTGAAQETTYPRSDCVVHYTERGKEVGRMDAQLSWVLEVVVKPGQLDAFRALMHELVESTRAEPGALIYEWFVSEDNEVVHLSERYADSAAVVAHLGTVGEKFGERFLAAVDPTRLTVMGSPSDEAQAALDGFGPTYLVPFGGFAR
jgi:quinol monooxygenase YgiN